MPPSRPVCHPTGMAFYGGYLLVANTYSDTISMVDTTTNEVKRTINLGLPIECSVAQARYGPMAPRPTQSPSTPGPAFAYVALYNA